MMLNLARLEDVVVKAGGADKYLDKRYKTQAGVTFYFVPVTVLTLSTFSFCHVLQADKMDFAKWLNTTFPPDPRLGVFETSSSRKCQCCLGPVVVGKVMAKTPNRELTLCAHSTLDGEVTLA